MIRAFLASTLLLAVVAAVSCDGSRGDPVAAAPAAHTDLRLFWDLHDRAKDLYAAGDFTAADEAYRAALLKKPDHPASLYNLAHIDFLLRRHGEALELLDRLRVAAPAETKANLLAALIRSDPYPGAPFDLPAAAADADRALTMNSEDSGPALVQGRIAYLAGDVGRARERLSISARANPKNAEALSLLGALALREGRVAESIDLFQRAAKAAEGSPPPAGVSGEGDTAKARAGERRDRLFQARWLLDLAGGAVGGSGGAAGSGSSLPPLLPEGILGPPLASGPPRSGAALAVASLSGGPRPEVTVGSREGPLKIYRLEDGALRESASIDLRGISALAALDIDGDGMIDLYCLLDGGQRESEPKLLLNRGGLRFEVRPAPGGPRRAIATVAVAVEGGGEGVVEVGPPSARLGPVRLIRRRPEGALGMEDLLPLEGSAAVAAVSLGPVSAGVAVGFAGRSPEVFRWDQGTLRPLSRSGLEKAGPARALAALDFDGDALLDLVLAEPAPAPEAQLFLLEGQAPVPSLRLFLRRPGGEFQETPGIAPVAAGATALATGDVDGDGAPDLIATAGGPEPWRIEPWWVFLSGEGFRAFRGPALPAPSFKASAAVVADLEGDGVASVLLAGGGLLPGDSGQALLLRGKKKKPAPAPAAR